MATIPPWSVKGVDRDTREIAKRAAQASGLTLGSWVADAIRTYAEAQAVHAAEMNGDEAVSAGDMPMPRPASRLALSVPDDAATIDDGRVAALEDRVARLEADMAEHRERSEHALADLARGFVVLADRTGSPVK
ncbi:hypothetical protein GCM10011505_04410 [Tistrella bauzanensis]|uniref:Uncharacterized protein n=1 Tax=Tistrella bauzanensis TaxID=657419 RepID=A0ABQ1I9M4_9PROT|nr:hypothetical protein [Tistrella bauzanensis]GGB26314.1 hypothetical protein GCM10011505_04410 [Tistrella bauzanensis]